jgi:hypothetical protein
MITPHAQLYKKCNPASSMLLQAILNAYYGEEYDALQPQHRHSLEFLG